MKLKVRQVCAPFIFVCHHCSDLKMMGVCGRVKFCQPAWEAPPGTLLSIKGKITYCTGCVLHNHEPLSVEQSSTCARGRRGPDGARGRALRPHFLASHTWQQRLSLALANTSNTCKHLQTPQLDCLLTFNWFFICCVAWKHLLSCGKAPYIPQRRFSHCFLIQESCNRIHDTETTFTAYKIIQTLNRQLNTSSSLFIATFLLHSEVKYAAVKSPKYFFMKYQRQFPSNIPKMHPHLFPRQSLSNSPGRMCPCPTPTLVSQCQSDPGWLTLAPSKNVVTTVVGYHVTRNDPIDCSQSLFYFYF